MVSGVERAHTSTHRLLLTALSGNMLLDAIEVSVVLIGLPTIAADLDVSLWTAQWLMSGFALGFAVTLLVGARVTARWGRRRVYLAAMAVFAVASVVGALADDVALLIATRVVKGCCAALTAPAGLAIITSLVPDGPARRRAISVYSLFGAAGFTVGLLVSGAFLSATWRWTFLFPAPIAVVLLVLAARALPRDLPVPPATGTFLRTPGLVRSALGAASLNGTYHGILLILVVEFQDWPPWHAAIALLPGCVPLAIAVSFTWRLVDRYGTHRLIALGAVAAFLGYAAYLVHPVAVLTLLLVQAGFVLSFVALNTQATAAVAPEQRGRAVALYQAGVQTGAVLVLPSVAALLAVGARPAALLVTAVAAVGVAIAFVPAFSQKGTP
jgi:MFS family permease